MISTAGPFRFRPLPVSELLDETFRLYRRYFALFVGIALVLAIPGLLIELLTGGHRSFSLLMQAFQNLGNPEALQALQEQQQGQATGVGTLLSSVVALILLPISVGALLRATADVALGREATIATVLRGTLARYWGIWGNLIIFFLVSIVLIWIFPLWLWITIRWSMAPPALIAEGVGPIRALSRSWTLVRGRWWRTLGILLLLGIIFYILFVVLLLLVSSLIFLLPGLGNDLRAAILFTGISLISILVGPFFYVAVTLLYFDLRVRKEGFDLEQLGPETRPTTALDSV